MLIPGIGLSQNALFQFSIDEGLTRSNVTVVFEDSRGILWVGTKGGGVYQLSGGRFMQDPEILRHTGYDIIDIHESEDGILYIQSGVGIVVHDGYRTRILPLSTDTVFSMTVCGNEVWYSDSSAVYRHANDNTRRIAQGRQYLLECRSGEAVLIAGNQLVTGGIERDLPLAATPQWSATYADEAALLLASAEGSILHSTEGDFMQYRVSLGGITCLREGGLGDIWVGSTTGLFVYHPADDLLQPMGEHNRLSSHINTLHFDRQNNLWIGTRDHGLLQYRGEPIARSRIADAADKRFVKARGSRHSALWITGTDGAVFRYDATADSMVRWTLREGGYQDIRAFFPDRFNRQWFVSVQGTLMVHIDTAIIDLGSEPVNGGIAIMSGDPAGRMWIESTGGKITVMGLAPKPGTRLLTFEGRQITGDSLTDGVVALFPHQKYEMVRVGNHTISAIAEGKCQVLYRTQRNILSAELSADGTLWMGLRGGGVMKSTLKQPAEPVTLIAPRFLQPYDILFIHKEKGSLWLGTERSILRLRLAPDESGIEEITTVYQAQNAEFDPGKFTLTTDGILAVLTPHDMLQIPTTSAIAMRNAPKVYISSVAVSGQELQKTPYAQILGGFGKQKEELVLPYRENAIAFSYAAATTEPGPLTFQWKLKGAFEDWSAPSVRNLVQFVGLAPGAYAFDVRVCNALGKCSMLAFPWSFTIRTALYHHWWFWVLLAAAVVLLVAALVRRRISTLKKQAQEEQERLRMQLKSLEMEQKALQLQMNPHFIFNVMQTIQAQMQRNHFAKARHSMSHFARLMRSMLDLSRRKEITLEEELEFLKVYLDLENACSGHPFEYNLTVARDVETFAITIPPMLIQPVVENAIKHGTTADNPHIDIEFYDDKDLLTCIVRDNGRGFSETDVDKEHSTALHIIRERIAAMGPQGELRIGQSTSGGAEITLVIPQNARSGHQESAGKR
jgi:ligand-binding sensor domain-containing protein